MARSSNWRINKSSIMAVEGAQILKALQKVAGAAGLSEGFVVKFATKSQHSGIDFSAKELVIGAGRIFQEAPLPADKMDVLTGLTIHEVNHHIIQTNRVWDCTTNNKLLSNLGIQEQNLLQQFVNIGEDIVIESMTRANPNLADYDKALYDWATTQMREAQPHKLLELWIEYGLGHKVDYDKIDNLPTELKEAMSQLVALTGWLRRVPRDYVERAEAYLSYWRVVKDVILNPPEPPQQSQNAGADTKSQASSGTNTSTSSELSAPAPDNKSEPDKDKDNSGSSESGAEPKSPQNPEQNNVAGQTDGNESSAPDLDSTSQNEEAEMDRPLAPKPEDGIDEDLADDIENALETEQEDITEEVAEQFREHQKNYRQMHPIIRSRESKTPFIKPNPQLHKRLERIMTIRKRLQARTMHGEQYGRIDKRHLHRIGTDERIFSLRYKFPDGFPNTRILIDLSSSMSGREADEVLEAAGALQTLVNTEVWCYYHDGNVRLIRVDDGKLIHRLEPDGDTPSGLAIVGISLGMRKDGLIIHLTDGVHNVGQAPWLAHWILQKRGISLINLIWGRAVGDYSLQGMNYRQLDGLADFPDSLYQILVEESKLSKIGGK